MKYSTMTRCHDCGRMHPIGWMISPVRPFHLCPPCCDRRREKTDPFADLRVLPELQIPELNQQSK